MKILGIETSCDETAAAIVEDGKHILSNIVYSQEKVHSDFGGVVPELASREHVKRIDSIVKKAVASSGLAYESIDGIAVTQGPGLIGSLLVGISFAKALSLSLSKPTVGVNHILAHLYAPELEFSIEYPALGLIVSGGHTSIYYVKGVMKYTRLARTRDDAAGEILDKIAKYLSLGYPGGPIIDKIAKKGDPQRYKFTTPKMSDHSRDFSFSGIKSAALRIIRKEDKKLNIPDFAASFQNIIVEYLSSNLFSFVEEYNPKSIILAGGVSRNSQLRETIEEKAKKIGLKYYLPSPLLCTDNAAMIAGMGYHYFQNSEFLSFDSPPFSRFEPKGFRQKRQ